MMLLKALIKQELKRKNLSYKELAMKIGMAPNGIRDLIENMQNHAGLVTIEKVMTVLGLFTFDNEEVDKKIKEELKKFEKSKKDYIY